MKSSVAREQPRLIRTTSPFSRNDDEVRRKNLQGRRGQHADIAKAMPAWTSTTARVLLRYEHTAARQEISGITT